MPHPTGDMRALVRDEESEHRRDVEERNKDQKYAEVMTQNGPCSGRTAHGGITCECQRSDLSSTPPFIHSPTDPRFFLC